MKRGTLAAAIAAVTQELSRPRFLRLVARLHVHERTTRPGTCPCCKSTTAQICETLPIADIILDLVLGDRIEEHEVEPSTWADLCSIAATEDLVFRCSQHQRPIILDETSRHLFASGGNRSSKTTCALIWLAIQWLKRGGRERRFWLVAPTTPKAFRLLEKLFKGTGESPRILPTSLIEYSPATRRSGDLLTRLVDGSLIDLRYFEGDPMAERLKSDAIVACVIDEAAHITTVETITALRGRCVDAGGRLFFASTATPTSILRPEIVEPALAFEKLPDSDPKKTDGTHPGSRYRFAAFPLIDNPWLPKANIELELRALDPNSPQVQRDFYGSWITSTGPLWTTFDPEKHILRHEARDFKDLGATYRAQLKVSDHQDITGKCVSLVFGRTNPHHKTIRAKSRRYILGTDVNVHPMTSIALQVTAPRGQEEDRDSWHFWAMEHVRTSHGSSFAHVDQLASVRFGEFIDPKAGGSPFAGCGVVVDAKAFGQDPTVHKFGGDPRGLPDLFARAGFDARAPLYVNVEGKGRRAKPPGRHENFMLLHRIVREGRLHVSDYCRYLIESFMDQQDSGDGIEPQDNDRLASPMDGLRYAIYAIVHADKPLSFNS